MAVVKPGNIDEYFAGFPKDIQRILKQIRATIKKAAPDAKETISYAMPAFRLNKGYLFTLRLSNNISGFTLYHQGIKNFQKKTFTLHIWKRINSISAELANAFKFNNQIVKFRIKETLEKAERKKTLRTCKNGHKYYKSSDFPTCTICEQERKPQDSFLSLLSAPARRSLENNGITTLERLSKWSEKEILKFYGLGKGSLPKLSEALANARDKN